VQAQKFNVEIPRS